MAKQIIIQECLKENVLCLPVYKCILYLHKYASMKDAYIRNFIVTLFGNAEHKLSLTLAN